jgi:glutamine phosphoribosylpyrophosphate amidotransferase
LTGGTVAPDDALGARRGDAVSGELTATLDASGVSTFRDVFAGEIVLLDDAGKRLRIAVERKEVGACRR